MTPAAAPVSAGTRRRCKLHPHGPATGSLWSPLVLRHPTSRACGSSCAEARSDHGLNIDAPGGGYSQLGFTASGSDMLGYWEDMLAMMMAGRAAEQIVIGKVSSELAGSDEGDLVRATRLTLVIERSLGFGAIQPLLYFDDKDPTAVLDRNPDLAARIHAKLETALDRAADILKENRGKLDALTKSLFDARALDGEGVSVILSV